MNTEQVKGKIKEAAGATQQQFGKVIGSTEQEAKGDAREVEGKTEKKIGDIKEGVKEIFKKP